MLFFLADLVGTLFEILDLPMDSRARKALGCLIGAVISFAIALLGVIVLAYFFVRITQP